MASVERVLARTLPDRTVCSVEPASRGNHKRTHLVTFADGDGVVVQQSDRPAALRTEAGLARAIRARTDIPTPAVLAEGRIEGDGYLVVERVPGTDLHERFVELGGAERQRVVRAFGSWLAACHRAFSFDGYGLLSLDGGTLVATEREWRPWFRSYLDAGLDALPGPLADLRPDVEAAVDPATLPQSPAARLFPWDFRPGNALYDDGDEPTNQDEHGVSALLDWGNPLAADPALSVAKAMHLVCNWYVDDPEPLRAAFRDGYRERRAWPAPPRAYRLAAVVRAAVDSNGTVTRPGYPERSGDAAVAFHRDRIIALL